ncbi:hypothetical protein KY289_001437 [Solanum tuberosum]|nr:hypothetical protein KY289_001437 [Solanum tuberosum]
MGPAQCDPTVSLPRAAKTLSSPPAKSITTTCRYCCFTSRPASCGLRALMKRNADENLKPTPINNDNISTDQSERST